MDCVKYGGDSKIIANGNKFKIVFNVESTCSIYDKHGCLVERYYQCETCRKEHVFGRYPLFNKPPYAFTPVFGKNSGVIFRSGKLEEVKVYRTVKKDNSLLHGYTEHIVYNKNMKRQSDWVAAIKKILKPVKCVARTKFAMANGYVAEIEFPIRTINISEAKGLIQVDTGPVVVPIVKEYDHVVDSLRLAHVAFFEKNMTSFICEEKVKHIESIMCCDYSRNVDVVAENELYCEEQR